MVTADERLKELEISLPDIPDADGNYVHAVSTSSGLLFLAGKTDNSTTGVVPTDVSVKQAYDSARTVGLLLLSVLHKELDGSLNRVKRIVKVEGMVRCRADFGDQPSVINGCSDLFLQVFGHERGRHARIAVGMAGLPQQATIEIAAVVEIERETCSCVMQ